MKNYCQMLVIVAVLIISGCAGAGGNGSMNKSQGGALLGSLGGALIGSQLGSDEDRHKNALYGGLGGLVVGYMVGNEMDKYDSRKINSLLEHTRDGDETTWVNPNTRKKYTSTPLATRYNNNTVTRDILINADANNDGVYDETVHATATRRSDGTWDLN